MTDVRIGVIGGSGFYQMEGLTDVVSRRVATPFGDTTDAFTIGTLEGERAAFLPRHGAGHRFSPTELPVKAAIWAFKEIGVEFIISVSAVGSLRERIAPLDVVIPDQLIDRTRNRASTFFGEGVVAHVGMADPFCPHLAETVYHAATATDATIHRGGTLVVIEGPAFSTRAESELYRQWGADIIGMTALPEAKLAREAEICYATIACCTDYDVWHLSEEDVTVEMVVQNLMRNVETAKQVVRGAVRNLPQRGGCPCVNALQDAIITNPESVPRERKQALRPILGRYMPLDPTTAEGEYQA
jgi:5'-methylthioadenosine phosphorylase